MQPRKKVGLISDAEFDVLTDEQKSRYYRDELYEDELPGRATEVKKETKQKRPMNIREYHRRAQAIE